MKRFVLGLHQESSMALSGEGQLTHDEAWLIAEARANPAAFDTLYQRYLTPVYRYLCLHTYNDEDAADLTQQVFLQALQALPNYRERQLPFAAWLFRIAHNLAVDSHRRRRPSFSWDWLPEALHPAAEGDPESIALENERLAQLRLLFERLSSDKRELLALRFGAGFTAREIGTVVGKSEEAVQKQIIRTIEGLRKQIKEGSK